MIGHHWLPLPYDGHHWFLSNFCLLWKSVAAINCSDTNIFPNIFIWFKQWKESHVCRGVNEGRIFILEVNDSFNVNPLPPASYWMLILVPISPSVVWGDIKYRRKAARVKTAHVKHECVIATENRVMRTTCLKEDCASSRFLSYSHLCISPRRPLRWTVPWCMWPVGGDRRWHTLSRHCHTGTVRVRSPQGRSGCRSHSRRCWSGPIHMLSFQDSARHSMTLKENNKLSNLAATPANNFLLLVACHWFKSSFRA